jgi:isoamylase
VPGPVTLRKTDQPDWTDDSHSLAFEVDVRQEHLRLYLILNAYWEPLVFDLPSVGKDGAGLWHRWIDTSLDSPEDIVPWQSARSLVGRTYWAEGRSVVVLIGEGA